MGYNRFLLLVAGLGGLLFGIDVGIIAGALPYLEATSGLAAGQLSFIVAAVLLGSILSTLFAGALADWLGRKTLMTASGALFVISVPVIALAHGFWPLVLGRILQGMSGGLTGVVVPLYLAECLGARNRGKGAGVFQLLLTSGLLVATLIGLFFSHRVEAVATLGDAAKLLAFKDAAWRGIFWVSLPPGILFVVGSLFVAESPRWLFRRGQIDAARRALLRSRTEAQAEIELKEMEATAAAEKAADSARGEKKESLLRRKYVVPFLLTCVILACNQATGINSLIGYNATILIQAGLGDASAHLGTVLFTLVNFLMTLIGIALVDRRGRKFLLSLGTGGVIVALVCVGLLFHRTEKERVDCRDAVQALVATNQTLALAFNQETVSNFLAQGGAGSPLPAANGADSAHGVSRPTAPFSLVVIYSYGDFHGATIAVRSDDAAAKPVRITRENCVPANKVVAFFANPFANLEAARTAPLKIENALLSPVPDARNGWLTAVCLFVFMAFFALGPGVCVWLALSELMPTRIRSNGMSIAYFFNHVVSTTIAAVFLPTVGKYGYATMFFGFAGCTVVYFITAAFFLPETKGKTLEEIEECFDGGKRK